MTQQYTARAPTLTISRLGRHTEAAITRASFTIERVERFSFRPNLLGTLGAPHILGTALRNA